MPVMLEITSAPSIKTRGKRKIDTLADDSDVRPADMEVVREMRQSIIDVLGEDISPETHKPPEESMDIDTEHRPLQNDKPNDGISIGD